MHAPVKFHNNSRNSSVAVNHQESSWSLLPGLQAPPATYPHLEVHLCYSQVWDVLLCDFLPWILYYKGSLFACGRNVHELKLPANSKERQRPSAQSYMSGPAWKLLRLSTLQRSGLPKTIPPISWLPPHERPWVTTTQLSHSQMHGPPKLWDNVS